MKLRRFCFFFVVAEKADMAWDEITVVTFI